MIKDAVSGIVINTARVSWETLASPFYCGLLMGSEGVWRGRAGIRWREGSDEPRKAVAEPSRPLAPS